MNSTSETRSGLPDEQSGADCLQTGDALLILRTSRALMLTLRKALGPVPLRLELWLLLESLVDAPKRPTELAAEVAGLKGSVSRWVAELHALGLVSYQFSEEDQRKKPVTITPRGLQQLELARERIAQAMRLLDLPIGERERDYAAEIGRRIQEPVLGSVDVDRR